VTTPREVPPVLVREAAPADRAAISDLITTAGLPLEGLDDDPVLHRGGGRRA
jgi:hypothetical protein